MDQQLVARSLLYLGKGCCYLAVPVHDHGRAHSRQNIPEPLEIDGLQLVAPSWGTYVQFTLP